METPFAYICDTEGFYQHYGECWLDAFTMIFLFADGLKEITQPAIYNTPIEALNFRLLGDKDPRVLAQIRQFVTALRDRFIRHHWNQVIRRHTVLPRQMAKRGQGEQAYRMAASGACILDVNSEKNAIRTQENYVARGNFGGTKKDILQILQVLIALYDMPGLSYQLSTQILSPPLGTRYLLSEQITPPTPNDIAYWIVTETTPEADQHAVAFYSCGGNQYIYDNNYGPLPFPWKQLFVWVHENRKYGLKIGFMDASHLPMPCMELIYEWYPVVYAISPDGQTLMYSTICLNNTIYKSTIPYNPSELNKIVEMVKFRSEFPARYMETPPPKASHIYPRISKRTVGGRRRTRNRSKRGHL